MRLFQTVDRWGRLTWHDRWLLCEALIWLAIARAMILIVPFRQIAKLASLRIRRPWPRPDGRMRILRRIQWSIGAIARRAPWRTLCFEQGLAAQFMLRRRGIDTVLYYGVAPDAEKGLAAHVWVRDGDVDVVGCEVASRFAVLVTFPPINNPNPT